MTALRSVDALLRRLPVAELFGYLCCSVLALALDTLSYWYALRVGAPLALAAALGFLVGVSANYLCSVRFVFRAHRLRDRTSEFAAFVSIGLVGLLLTEALLWLFVSGLGLAPLPAKLATAGFVFVFNFGARKALLFSTARPKRTADSRLEPLA